jgi:hypothetical protein
MQSYRKVGDFQPIFFALQTTRYRSPNHPLSLSKPPAIALQTTRYRSPNHPLSLSKPPAIALQIVRINFPDYTDLCRQKAHIVI